MLKDKGGVRGRLHILLKDSAGNVKVDKTIDNLVVTSGIGHFTSRLVGTAQSVFSHMAVGSSNAAPAAGQIALTAIIGSAQTLTSGPTVTTTSVTNDSVQCARTFAAGENTGIIEEAGLFANAGAVMVCRTLTGTIDKQAGDSLAITWTVQFAAA